MTTLLFLLATSAPTQPLQAAPATDPKQLAAWVADLSDKDFAKQNAARDALVKAGPKAKSVVPDLVKLLGNKNAQVTWAMIHAADVLGAIGPDAKEAVPPLLALVKPTFGGSYLDRLAVALAKIDSPKREATLALLMSSGKGTPLMLVGSGYLSSYPTAVAGHLLALCKDKSADVRQRAVVVLAGLPVGIYHPELKPLALQVGDAGKDAPAIFQTMLTDEDPGVRITAAYALSRVTPEQTHTTIPVVIATMTDAKLKEKIGYFRAADIFRPIPDEAAKAIVLLFDADDYPRSWAINTLVAMPVRGQLEAVLKEGTTARTRQAAAITIGSRYSDRAKSAPALKSALTDQMFIVRFAAAVALVQVGGRGTETAATGLPVLIEGLKQEDEGVRLAAAQNLRIVGDPARPAVPELQRGLGDRKPEVALEIALALVEIARADAVEAVPVLINGVKSENESAATRAARALIVLGPAAKSAVPELVKRFDAKTPPLRIAAAEAAARIDPDRGENAAGVLVAIIKQFKGGEFCDEALSSVARIGLPAKSALPVLLDVFQSAQKKPEYFRVELALAVMAIDPETARPLVAWIRDRVMKEGDEDGIDIARQIRQLGASAKPLLAELIVMLKSKESYVRECATVALAAIGPDAKDSLPRLKELADKDAIPNIRKLASAAVKKIEAK